MADSQRKTANLFSESFSDGYSLNANGLPISFSGRIANLNPISINADTCVLIYQTDKNTQFIYAVLNNGTTIRRVAGNSIGDIIDTSGGNELYICIYEAQGQGIVASEVSQIMLNAGSTPKPYEPYWQHSLRKLTTATEAVENPLYSDGTAITAYTIKGNEEHTGTPSPQNPVMPQGVGNKTANLLPRPASARTETIGDMTFSIDSNGTLTVNGSTGENTVAFYYDLAFDYTFPTSKQQGGDAYLYYWNTFAVNGVIRFFYNDTSIDYWSISPVNRVISKFDNLENATVNRIKVEIPANSTITNGKISLMVTDDGEQATGFEPYGYKIPISSGQQTIDIYIGDLPLLKSLDGTAVDEISNGTLTRRVDSDGSVLPTPITTQITMPSIPTADGANSITVDTTVQPSEFTATWTGWHDSSVKEYDGSDWQ